MTDEIKTPETESHEKKSIHEAKQQETEIKQDKKTGEFSLSIIKIAISAFGVFLTLISLVIILPNTTDFVIVTDHENNVSICSGNIGITKITVENTGIPLLKDWVFKYDRPIYINASAPTGTIMTFIPNIPQYPLFSTSMVVGVPLDTKPESYTIYIQGAGKTTQYKPNKLIISQCEDKSINNKELAENWCHQGIRIMELNSTDNYLDALKWFDVAIKLDPQNGQILYHEGIDYMNLHQTSNACKLFNDSLNITQKNANVWLAKAEAQEKLGNNRDALDCINKSLELNPEVAQYWRMKGMLLDRLDSKQYAQKCFNLSDIIDKCGIVNENPSEITKKPSNSLFDWISNDIYFISNYIIKIYHGIENYFIR